MIVENKLPYLNIIEPISYEQNRAFLIDVIKNISPSTPLYESSDEMVQIEAFAYTLTHRDALFNERLKAVLPIFATDKNLDDSCKNWYGTERLEGESDKAFLDRSLLSLQQSSTAGAEWSYIYHIKSVDRRIIDVLPYRPRAGSVNVTWHTLERDKKEIAILQKAIERKLIDKKIKPLGDKTHYVGDETLHIQRAKSVEFTVDATIRTHLGVVGDTVKEEALAQLNAFILTLKIGQDIKCSKIVAMLDVEGVDEIILHTPLRNIAIGKDAIATLKRATIKMEGRVDE